jgi:mono/diheme cytochrome c family protein
MATIETTNGQQIYHKYVCHSCHGEDGQGNCDLRQAHKKYPTNDTLIQWIRDPSRFVPNSKMPTWEGVIEEAEYEPLAKYIRLLGERSLRSAGSG